MAANRGALRQAVRRPVRTVRRLMRLWGLYARMDALWITRDRKLFLTWYLADAVMSLAAVTGMLLLAQRFAGIGSWTKPQIVFLLGYAMVVSGIIDTLFGYNISHISRRLGRGQLDHTLLQPQPLWMSLLTEGFCPFSGTAALLPGLTLLGWGMRSLSLPPSLAWIGLLLLNLCGSCGIVLAFQFAWGSLAFWAPRGAEEINSASMELLWHLKSFPLDGVSALLAGSLLTALPVGFIAWMPCRALLGLDNSAWGPGRTPLAALAFALLAAGIFKRGLWHYGRTGSQRYLGRGHRS